MKRSEIVYWIIMGRSKKFLTCKYGNKFWEQFKERSDTWLKYILPKTPGIGSSIFAFNYNFCPAYIAWYKSFMELGLTSEEAGTEIWMMNERLITLVPGWLMSVTKNAYLGGFRKKALKQEKNADLLHPYDWKIHYREISDDVFEIDITECGMLKLSKDFDALGMFPMICRMDYLFSHHMGNGFLRTMTLGDGDDCCNCRYIISGNCEWSPENGFETRK